MTEEDSALPRKRDIEAAIAAHNATDRETALLPHSTARLLAVIFPRDNVCRRSEASLMADGFEREDSPGVAARPAPCRCADTR